MGRGLVAEPSGCGEVKRGDNLGELCHDCVTTCSHKPREIQDLRD